MTIGAIGDVLLHDRVYERQETEPGVFDFGPPLEAIEPLVSSPDFLMANQESVPGGTAFGLSAYPSFNSPKEIVYELKDVGVDMIIAANNHTIDRGIPPLMSALDLYDELELPYAGAYRDAADRENHRIIEVDGITFGILSYTFSTNGIPIPTGFEDSVALIEEDRIRTEVGSLREKADVLIVHMHWGNEYERLPNHFQTSYAQLLADEQVDLIFGHHPHVLQPIEQLKQPDGKDTIVFYSLGNFYSGQDFDFTDVGGVATVEVTKTVNQDQTDIQLTNPFIEPTQVIRGEDGEYIAVPMNEADSPSIAGETYEETVEHVTQWQN
ncbi:CapA family protein [Jeotgalibacillus campisalis]|uniref:Capsular polysaccharide biosynthesis protein CapA n=1 Tax=Jeotgalibacillus campisalis TaxID=220754 RepID=A0A0C2VQF3_9BACL|nr:CapA family protein [Jeotgalibacillus campisalis]KIL46243.1 capsular polysaccharide biosynthesis protein CapA [Jeotgalibacillus campisalis]